MDHELCIHLINHREVFNKKKVSAFPIYTYFYLIVNQRTKKCLARELTALVSIENLWFALLG